MKKFLKQFYWVILGIFLLGVVFSAPALKQWNNSKLELSQYRMLFTDTGLPNGTPVMDINSGWSNISYWPLLDGEWNPYITWWVLDGFIPFSWSDTEVYWTIKFQEWVWLWSNPWVLDFGVAQIQAQDPWLSSPYFEIKNVAWLWDAYSSIMIQDNLLKFSYISWSQGWTFHKLELWEWALEYKWDYSDNFVDWSLVDKRYVDGELSWIETFWEFDWVTLNPTATWDVSLKIGLGSEVDISNSVSIGQYAYANWSGSYAFGNAARALWEGSFAIWRQAKADGLNAYSVWFYNEANKEDSYVFGNQSVSDGFAAMVFWQHAKANNAFSTAIWIKSEANADYSISAGNNTITNSVSSMAIWRYNVWNTDSVFEVGFGTNTSRENLFEVKNNWNIYISKLTGYTCLATDSVGMVYDNTGVFANYVPRTAVDTGWNNTGSDTIIPSEKLVWSLVSWLNNNYVPFWDGSKFINSSIYKTINFLSLANTSTWALFNIYSDFIYASTNIVDWKITENRFKIWTPDSWTTGVYIEWKMLDWVIDIYADTGVYVKSKYFSAISWAAKWDYSVAMWRNANATWKNAVALWEFARAYWDDSIALGRIATAHHDNWVAIGRWPIASGMYSVAIWNSAKTNANDAVALWQGVLANRYGWISVGSYNNWFTDSIFELWYWTNDNFRRNAITVDTSANMTLAGKLTVWWTVSSYGSLYKSGLSQIPATADTGDRWQWISGTQFVTLVRTGWAWVVKASLTND